MSKAVLISIQPKWCGLIANGAKTIEVRKTRPHLAGPFKCYIYCTKPKKYFTAGCGKVIGEFVCNKLVDYAQYYFDSPTELELKELDQKFQNTALFGKLANLGDDISDEFIVNASIFKKFVTGERVQVQNKGEKPFEFNNYAKFLFSANNIPRIKDKTGAVLRRLLIVPFNANFTKDDPDYDSDIKYKLQEQEVMEYMIVLGINALKRVLERKGFTESAKVQEQLKEYEETNNPIIGFFEECEMEDFQIENELSDKVYKRYREYCLANNFNPMSKNEFSKQVCRKLNMTTKTKKISGKVFRIYVKND